MVTDELETKHDLLGCHQFITELLVDVDDIGCVLAVHECAIDFMENHVDIVIKIVVTSSMD